MTPSLLSRVDAICAETVANLPAGEIADEAARIRDGLHGPLRVAIVGRVKAGKSTLLNALLRERIAPTDAGECTKYVCWYRHALTYDVGARLTDGGHVTLPFSRGEDALDIDLEASPGVIERLEVGWPTPALSRLTLIDTPGVGSTDESARVRIASFLGEDGDEIAPEADAVVYLMRHLHRTDAELLESLYDRSIASASPVNAVAVLSRADEICSARPDAMDSAAAIAERYANDPHLRAAVADVIPMAGLLAETGSTLRESEVAWLRSLAAAEATTVAMMLLSVDRFRRPELGPLTVEVREHLLRRFGLFGLRFALQAVADGRCETATALSRALIELSGIGRLHALVDEYFTSRSEHLKARSALLKLRALGASVEPQQASIARAIRRAVEQVEASAHELAELRLLHLALTGTANLTPEEHSEVRRLVSGKALPERLGVSPEAPHADQVRAALLGVEHWRDRALSPLVNRDTATACEIAARSYEGLYAALTRGA